MVVVVVVVARRTTTNDTKRMKKKKKKEKGRKGISVAAAEERKKETFLSFSQQGSRIYLYSQRGRGGRLRGDNEANVCLRPLRVVALEGGFLRLNPIVVAVV